MIKEKGIKGLLVEFVLIVVGVTLALWLENTMENIKERSVEEAYIASFQEDWKTDKSSLENVIQQNEKLKEKTSKLFSDLMANQLGAEDIGRVFVILNYQYYKPQNFTLQSIQAAGEFRLLRNETFKRNILKLQKLQAEIEEAQHNYQQALDNYAVPMIVENIDLAQQRIANPDFLTDYRFYNLIQYTINDLDSRIKLYKSTLKFIETLQQSLHGKLNNS